MPKAGSVPPSAPVIAQQPQPFVQEPAPTPAPAPPMPPPPQVQAQIPQPVPAPAPPLPPTQAPQPAPAPAPTPAYPTPGATPPPAPPMISAPPPMAPAAPIPAPPSAPTPTPAPPTLGAAPIQGSDGFLQSLDFSNVTDADFRLLDPSLDYEFRITNAQLGRSASNNHMLTVNLEVTHPKQYRGVSVVDNIAMTPNALWRSKSLFRACELLNENGRFMGNSVADLVDYIVGAQIKHDTYTPVNATESVTRNKIAGSYHLASLSPEINGGLEVAAPAPAAPAPQPNAPAPPLDWGQPPQR